jgi:hypothetical protein
MAGILELLNAEKSHEFLTTDFTDDTDLMRVGRTAILPVVNGEGKGGGVRGGR